MEPEKEPMTTHAPAAHLALPGTTAARRPERLPPAIALPIIGALSITGWYAIWKLGGWVLHAAF